MKKIALKYWVLLALCVLCLIIPYKVFNDVDPWLGLFLYILPILAIVFVVQMAIKDYKRNGENNNKFK